MTERNTRPIYSLLIANCLSLIGASLTVVAVPWFVLETTGSAGKAGLSGAAAFLPSFVAGIFGGAVIDRVGARRTAIAADIVSGTSIIMVPLLHHTVGLEFWQLLLLLLLSSSLDIPGVTARRALLPELATLGQIRLERVNAILEGNWTISGFIGPPLAGILIGFIGASNVLWIDGGTSLLSAVTLLLTIPRLIHAVHAVESRGYVQDLKDGLTFLWREPVVRWISITLSLTNLFGAPFFALMIAVYAKERYDDPRYLGFMLSAFSIGMVVGTAFYGWIGFRVSRRALMVVFLMGLTISYWPLALEMPFGVLVTCFALGGLLDGPINPLLVTVRQERIPVTMRGRVFASTSAISQVFPPISIPLAGLGIEHFGLTRTVVVFALFALVAGVLLAVHPVWKRMDETAPVTSLIEGP
jgi:MFS family permease